MARGLPVPRGDWSVGQLALDVRSQNANFTVGHGRIRVLKHNLAFHSR